MDEPVADRFGAEPMPVSEKKGTACGPARLMWWVAVCCLSAMALDPDKSMSEYLYTAFGPDDGLPHHLVMEIYQSRDGYLWAGTQNGLARFNGVTFQRMGSPEDRRIWNAYISVITEDSDGVLWVGTRGSGLLQYTNREFKVFGPEQGLDSMTVGAVQQDLSGRLWVGTDAGLFVYRDGRFVGFAPDELVQVFDLCCSEDDRIWVGSSVGLFKVRLNQDGVAQVTPWVRGEVTVLGDRGDQGLWVGTRDRGMLVVDPHRKQATRDVPGLTGIPIRSMCTDGDGNTWIGTDGAGLLRWRDGVVSRHGSGQPLRHNRVFSLTEDHEGSIWMASQQGLIQVQDTFLSRYTAQSGLCSGYVWSISASGDRVLISTEGGGLSILEDDRVSCITEQDGLSSDSVLTAIVDRQGRIWAGTRFGLNLISKDGIEVFTQADGLADDYVRCLFEDAQGGIWIGTRNGLSHLLHGAFKNFDMADGLAGNVVRCLLEDHENHLWVGTDAGLCFSKADDRSHFNVPENFGQPYVRALFEDDSSAIWIGTYGHGVYCFRAGEFQHISRSDGLYHDVIYEILQDDHGLFWFGTHNAIFSVPREELMGFLEGRWPKISCDVHGDAQDILRVEYTGGVYPSGAVDHRKRIWFPTSAGAVVLDPKRSKPPSVPARMVLESLLINGVERKLADGLSIEAGARNIEFHFAALSFRAPKKIRYFYKIDGVDPDWIDAGNRRVAFYNYLPPKSLVFRVKAQDHQGVWSANEASLSFRVEPLFYQTIQFFLGIGLALFLLGFFLRQSRLRAIVKRRRELEQVVALRTRDLEAANTRLVETAEVLQKTQRQLIDAAHHAGMAEFSSELFHNLGNHLNSINVSLFVLEEQLNALDEAVPRRIAGLFEEEDEIGQRREAAKPALAQVLEKFAQRIGKSRARGLEELDCVRRQVGLINRVVESQREATKNVGLIEPIDLVEIARDVLSLHREACERLDIEIQAELADVGCLSLQKFKLYQITINLVINAIDALKSRPQPPNRVLSLHLEREEKEVTLRVSDNGVGIARNDLDRIFSQGFSTKPEGHGYGLHYCANVVRELGGTIEVHSAGLDQGATFVVRFPTTA